MIQVKGNGNIVSKTIPVSSFLRLHVAVRGTTELIQSQEEKIEVEMDENLLEYVEAANAGRTLFVGTEGKIKRPNYSHCVVRIYFRQLENLVLRSDGGNVLTPSRIVLQNPLELKVQAVGDVTLHLSTPQLKASLQMEGNITLLGDCGTVEIRSQSQGNIMAKELYCQELKLKNQSQGNIEVFADKKIWLSHMGQGWVHYYGDAQLMDVKQWGDGEVRHMS